LGINDILGLPDYYVRAVKSLRSPTPCRLDPRWDVVTQKAARDQTEQCKSACPIREACLAMGVETGGYGVYGGEVLLGGRPVKPRGPHARRRTASNPLRVAKAADAALPDEEVSKRALAGVSVWDEFEQARLVRIA